MTSVQEKTRLENMKQYGFGPEVMKTIKVCNDCGAKVDSNLLFCSECGKPLPDKSLYMMYVHSHFVCNKCKTVVSSKYKFCPQCGEQLISD